MKMLNYLLLSLFFTVSLFAEASYPDLEQRVKRLEEQVAELLDKQSFQEQIQDIHSKNEFNINDEKRLFERFSEKMYQKEEDNLYPWLDLNKWKSIKLGMSPKDVIEILGKPTLDELSLNKRIDNVFTYKGRVVSTNKKVEGKVRFYKEGVIEILFPSK